MATNKDYGNMCSNWTVLQKHLNHLTEKELLSFISIEKKERKRVNILTRLYSRYAKVRREREMKKLLS